MNTATPATATEAAIWTRVIHRDGEISPATARALLKLEFDEQDRQRMHDLARKVQENRLTPAEEHEIDHFERVGSLLAILKSQARKVLNRN